MSCLVLGLAGILAGRAAALGADDPLKLARQALDIANYEDALRYLNRVLADDPGELGVRALKGYAFYRLGQLDQALGELQKERERFPGNEDGWTLAVAALREKGDLDEAMALARGYLSAFAKEIKKRLASESIGRVVKTAPNGGLPSFVLAKIAGERGLTEEAEYRFREALKLGYDDASCRTGLAGLALRAGLPAEALKRITETRDSALKEGAEILTLEAMALRGMGQKAESLGFFSAAADVEPFEAWTLRNCAVALIENGRHGQAVERLSALLRIHPGDFQARELLDAALRVRTPEAGSGAMKCDTDFKILNKTIYRHNFSGNSEALAVQANFAMLDLIRAGETEAAAGFLARFLVIYRQSPTLEYNLAQLCNAREARLECLRHAWRAVTLKPDFRDAWDLAANALFKAADYGGAVHLYAQAVGLDPSDPEARYNLGCAQYAAGDMTGAEESLREAIRLEAMPLPDAPRNARKDEFNPLKVDVQVRVHPVSVPAYLNLAKLYSGTQRGEQALDCLVLAIKLAPQTVDAYFELGKLRAERGEAAEAAECFRKYVELGGYESRTRPYLKKKTPKI